MRYSVVSSRFGSVRLLISDLGAVIYNCNDVMQCVGYAKNNFSAYFLRNGVDKNDCVKIGNTVAHDANGNSITLYNFGWVVNLRGLKTFFNHCVMPAAEGVKEWLLGLDAKVDKDAGRILMDMRHVRELMLRAAEKEGPYADRYRRLLEPAASLYEELRHIAEEGKCPY